MERLNIPLNYQSKLNLRETQKAIKFVKDTFQKNFVATFGFERVSAPMMVWSNTGINDDLNGVERPVHFDLKTIKNKEVEIVHSLAKWKRNALKEYNFSKGEGLYTDMNAIRRDEDLDNLHSIYVDQWDWEMVISEANRNIEYLQGVVKKIVASIVDTLEQLKEKFPLIDLVLTKDVYFITTEQLLQMYPNLSPKEREKAITKKYKTVFLMKIGDVLSNGTKHDGRAPDYDDWQLNGDILFYNEILDEAFEVSSMGIRVDSSSLLEQLEKANAKERLQYSFHQGIVNNTLPLSIGGGIGQSRLCMLLLQKAHIGEVQASIWDEQMINECRKNNINLL